VHLVRGCHVDVIAADWECWIEPSLADAWNTVDAGSGSIRSAVSTSSTGSLSILQGGARDEKVLRQSYGSFDHWRRGGRLLRVYSVGVARMTSSNSNSHVAKHSRHNADWREPENTSLHPTSVITTLRDVLLECCVLALDACTAEIMPCLVGVRAFFPSQSPRLSSSSTQHLTLSHRQSCLSLTQMGAITLNDAKGVLEIVTNVLDASPIPDPFKSAVSAIPTLALSIVEMAEVCYTFFHG
jgi:hypothetical protein